jgi:hypothetical protein
MNLKTTGFWILIMIFLNCASEIKNPIKEDSLIDCAKSSVTSENYGKVIIKVETKDESFLLKNVSVNFSKLIPSVYTDTFLMIVSPIIFPSTDVTIPIIKQDSICNPILNLRKDSIHEIKLPVGEYYSSFSNDHERDFKFEADEDKLILFMFGYSFDRVKKENSKFQLACQNKFEKYIWGYNGGKGGYVRNFNACPMIKIEKDKAIVIRIIVSEKIETSFGETIVKFIPGLLLFGLGPFTNRPLSYYNQRKYEVIME